MTKRTLNDRLVNALKPAAPGKRYDVMDAVTPGFGVRITDKGTRTFFLRTRFPGASDAARREIGKYGEIGLDNARQVAREWIGSVRRGDDPKVLKEQAEERQRLKQSNTFKAVLDDFARLQLVGSDPTKPLQRKGAEVERDLRRDFEPTLGGLAITEITWTQIVAVIDDKVASGASYQAHNLLGSIRRLFNWAIARGKYGLAASPCDRRRPKDVIGKKRARGRILSDDELRAFWKATERLGYPYGPLYRMLLLTIQRLSQVSEATDVEFDMPKREWFLSGERMKGEDDDPAPHLVPLSKPVFQLVEAIQTGLPKAVGGRQFLFSYDAGATAVNSFSKAKTRLDALMLEELKAIAAARGADPSRVELAPWKNHDLRRTGRTHLSALPVPDIVRELVIAHAKPELHKVYDLYSYLDEKRYALDLWATRLLGIVEPRPSNVVTLAVG